MRREIFTTPGLVTARRSILGPPAEGRPGPSLSKSAEMCFYLYYHCNYTYFACYASGSQIYVCIVDCISVLYFYLCNCSSRYVCIVSLLQGQFEWHDNDLRPTFICICIFQHICVCDCIFITRLICMAGMRPSALVTNYFAGDNYAVLLNSNFNFYFHSIL